MKVHELTTASKRAPHMMARNWVLSAIESDTDECLIWPYAKLRNGYGQFSTGAGTARVHRHICIAVHGAPSSPVMEAAHNCGNRACGNPRHIRWATPKENHADQIRHGTINRGARHGHVKLTEQQVRDARASGLPASALARKYGVAAATMQDALTRRTWSWLDAA